MALVAALVWALLPFATAFIGALVLYVIFDPVNAGLKRLMPPGWAAGATVAITVVTVIVPIAFAATVLVSEVQNVATEGSAALFLEQIQRVRIGDIALAPVLTRIGERAVTWLQSSALGLAGSVTRLAFNLTVAFFTLFYLFVHSGTVWPRIRPFIPFSEERADYILTRFRNVTFSTILGSGLTAVAQGTLLWLGFWVAGVPSPAFWGLITAIFSIVPVLGSGLVWGPAALLLILADRNAAGIGLAIWGFIVVANVDMLIRPWVYRQYANIHPLVTVVGAIAGVPIFGLLGLLIGPLALSYVFELVRMYREEYLADAGSLPGATGELRLPGWRITGHMPPTRYAEPAAEQQPAPARAESPQR